LWGQRQEALRSPEYTLPELRELEERIEAHVQGLLVGGENTIPFIEEGLSQDDPQLAFAASYILLRLNIESTARQVMEAFLQAEGEQLDGIGQALCHGSIDMVIEQLKEALASGPAPVAVSAAEALAFHKKLDLKTPRLAEFPQDENANVRRAAWRLIMLGSTHGPLSPDISAQLSEAAMNDEDPTVKRQAIYTAAWTRQQWLLEHCRKLSNEPSPDNWDAILLLAILGKPSDLERILVIAKATELGPQRFLILGAFGHPNVVEILLQAMQSEDSLTAVAASEAFTKITGADIESDQTVQVPPEDGSEPDEFEQEFLDEVTLPDPASARNHWQEVKDNFSSGTRWCRGSNLTQPAGKEVLDQLDLESRWQACLRGRFEGTWQGNLIDLEQFPQK
ncbi:MAG: hypothetical protein ACYSYL_18670, partial [Planctomycetota bacterium]